MNRKKVFEKPARKTASHPRADGGKSDGGSSVIEKIAGMPEPYRAMGERIHALILRTVPSLQPTLWYGMPAYMKDGRRICFFRADKYLTFGLTAEANHTPKPGAKDQLLECAWYLAALDDATEARLAEIVQKAVN